VSRNPLDELLGDETVSEVRGGLPRTREPLGEEEA
jgi:hypothetical protein